MNFNANYQNRTEADTMNYYNGTAGFGGAGKTMNAAFAENGKKAPKERKTASFIMERLEKMRMALLISGIVTLVNIVLLMFSSKLGDIGLYLLIATAVAAVISYCICGAEYVMKVAVALAKFGWFVCPFPIDLDNMK